MAELPVGSLTLAILRKIADMNQSEVEEKAGTGEGSCTYYERRQEPPPEILTDLVSGMSYRVPSYIIRRTGELIAEARAALDPARAPDPEEVARREWEEQAWTAFRDLQRRLKDYADANMEHFQAPYLWVRLDRHSAMERLFMVKTSRDLWSPGLCALVGEKSATAAAHDGQEAEELARLAIEIARRVPGGEAGQARLEGLAQAFLGNALRVRGQLPAADAAFALYAKLWSQGAGTFHELLDPSRPLDLEASLRREQRQLPESLALLERAYPLARSARARGRILLLRAKALEEKGDHEQALVVLDEAEPLVFQAGDPHYIFALTINRNVNLCAVGRAGEAAVGLKEVKELANRLNSTLHMFRVRWLEGRIAAAFGQKEDAMTAFREVWEAFMARNNPYDSALVLLELAVLLLEAHRTSEVRELTRQVEPIFASQGVHREALMALRLFVDSASKEQATVELAQRVLNFLRRSRYNSEVRFEAEYYTPFPERLRDSPGKGASE